MNNETMERLEQLIESILRGEQEGRISIAELLVLLSQPTGCDRFLTRIHH